MSDIDFMREALKLARRGQGRTSPNPMVGAIVVKGGRVAGRGWHLGPGRPHAEVAAIDEAGSRARGATLYLTLEPCTHHGRTPPCVGKILASRIKRVVAAMRDPDPRVNGRGIRELRKAGVEAEEGALEAEARRLNAPYVMHRTRQRPLVTYKAAITVDGLTAAADGSSKWISGEAARRDAHRERARVDAIAIGAGTVLADDPRLTARGVPAVKAPLRVVFDSRGRTPSKAQVLSVDAPSLFVVSGETRGVSRLRRAGADVFVAPGSDGRTSIAAALEELAARGVMSVLLEGGGTLAGAFIEEGSIDRFLFYVAPKLLGSGAGAITSWAASSLASAVQLEISGIRRFGDDVRIEAYRKEGR